MGIKELKEALKLAIEGVKAGIKVAEDKKVDLADLPHVMGLLMFVGPGLEGIDKIPAELMDLNGEEGAEVVAYVAAELSIDDVKAKAIAVAAVKAAVHNYELYKAIKA